MTPYLHLEAPGRAPILYEIGNTTGIGRASSNQICLKDDFAVSRQHALIRRQGEQEYFLIDMGSANGTLLNGKLIIGPTLLRNSDVIQVGEASFRFELPGPSPEEVKKLSQTAMEKTRVAVHMSTMVILVCDIRNFTRIGELLNPDQLARFLGSWFRQTQEVIAGLGGVVDKYIGDAVMAYWPVEAKEPDAAAEKAVRAALKIHALARQTSIPGRPRLPLCRRRRHQPGPGLERQRRDAVAARHDHHGRRGDPGLPAGIGLQGQGHAHRGRVGHSQGSGDEVRLHRPGRGQAQGQDDQPGRLRAEGRGGAVKIRPIEDRRYYVGPASA